MTFIVTRPHNLRFDLDCPVNERWVNKWYYMNLDERVDKHHAQIVNAIMHGVPRENLERFPAAIENKDCPEDISTLARMIVDDGFPEWWIYIENSQYFENAVRGPQSIAADWTKLRLLRHIVEQEENAVMCTDLGFINMMWVDFQDWIHRMPDDLRVLYMQWWYDDQDHHHVEQHEKMRPTSVPGVYDNFALPGAIAVFFTHQGAKDRLELWRKHPQFNAEMLHNCVDMEDPNALVGYYGCDPIPINTFYTNPNYGEFGKKDKKLWKT